MTDANRLVRAGYQYLAELNYLVCFRDHFPLEKPNCGLNFGPGSPSQTTRLEKLVERTYVDSLDCVGLDGMRPIGDVLVGYRATGRYRPEWWLIATHAGQDVGCVLLADHPEQEQCELMYLGMVPEVRGRGWGVGATRHVQWMMRGISRSMVLAVKRTIGRLRECIPSQTSTFGTDDVCMCGARGKSRSGSPQAPTRFPRPVAGSWRFFLTGAAWISRGFHRCQETSLKSWRSLLYTGASRRTIGCHGKASGLPSSILNQKVVRLYIFYGLRCSSRQPPVLVDLANGPSVTIQVWLCGGGGVRARGCGRT